MHSTGPIGSAVAKETSLPVSFNTLAIEKAGDPVSLQQKTVTALLADEVLIRVSHASINKMDPLLARMNMFDLPTPYVLGFDFSGEIVRCGGAGHDGLGVGDIVFGKTGLGGGCYAEYLVAKRNDVLPSGTVPAAEASTYGVAYLTAYESLVMAGGIHQHEGKWIYVAGAGGGVGHFAAQIARLHGLKVIGSAGKAASLNLVRDLHVDHVIDYTRQDVVREIMSLTGGQGVDLVYDSTCTQTSYIHSAVVVAAGGQYIRLGTPAQVTRFGAEDMTSVVADRGARLVIGDLGRYGTDPVYKAQTSKLTDGLRQAVNWYHEGKLKPVITRVVPFEALALQQVFEAFLEGTVNVGKIVVQCGEQTT